MRLPTPLICAPVLAALALSACFGRAGPGPAVAPTIVAGPDSLPPLPVLPTTQATALDPAPARGITVTAIDADARSLLIAIAREAGISLVVSSDVRRRVSVSLTNASPDDAIAAIIAQAGLTVSRSAQATASVVFYQLPMNVNEAPAEVISVRFGVSSELANWVVENRPPPAAKP